MPRWPEIALAAAVLVAVAGAGEARMTWPHCHRGPDDDCPPAWLEVTLRHGEARLAVQPACHADWRHAWGIADARQTIRQWTGAAWSGGTGRLCIPLAPEVDEIVAVPLGGHCGYEGMARNAPGPGATLRRGGHAIMTLRGCHAAVQDLRFGGVALRFADSYGFGDAYAAGHFYGVYDGFGRQVVAPTDAAVFRIADFNTFHYRIDIRAGGSTRWRQPLPREDHGR